MPKISKSTPLDPDLMEDDSMIVHPPTQAVDALDSEPSDQPPANEEGSDGGDELWSVSAILDERTRGGKREYKLAWESINPGTGEVWEPNWEPARNANAALVQDWNSVKALKASMAAQRKSFALSQPVTKEKRKPRSSRADSRESRNISLSPEPLPIFLKSRPSKHTASPEASTSAKPSPSPKTSRLVRGSRKVVAEVEIMPRLQKQEEQESGRKNKGKQMEEIIIDDESEEDVQVVTKPSRAVPDSQSQEVDPVVASSLQKVSNSDDSDNDAANAEVSTRLIVPSDPAPEHASTDDDVEILETTASASSDERNNSQYIAPLRPIGGISRTLPIIRPFGTSRLAPPPAATLPTSTVVPIPQRAPAPAPKALGVPPSFHPSTFFNPLPQSSQSEDPIVNSSPNALTNPHRTVIVRADAPRPKKPAQLALISAASPRPTNLPVLANARSRTAFDVVRSGGRRAMEVPLLKPVRSMLPSPPLDGEDEGGVRARVQHRPMQIDLPPPAIGGELFDTFGLGLDDPFGRLGEAFGMMGGEGQDMGGDDFSAMIDFDGGEGRGEMRDADAGGGGGQGERAQAPTQQQQQQQNGGNVPPVVVVPSSFPASSFGTSSAGGFSNGGQPSGGGRFSISDLLNPSHAFALPSTSKRVSDPASTAAEEDLASKKARTSQPPENRTFDPPAPNTTFSPTLARVLNADVPPPPLRQRSISPGTAMGSPSVRAVSVAASNSSRNASPAPAMPNLAVLLELIRATKYIDELDGTKAEVSRFVSDPQAYLASPRKPLCRLVQWAFELNRANNKHDIILLDTVTGAFKLRRVPLSFAVLATSLSHDPDNARWPTTPGVAPAAPAVVAPLPLPPASAMTREQLEREYEIVRVEAKKSADELALIRPLAAEAAKLKVDVVALTKAAKSNSAAKEELEWMTATYQQASSAAVERANEARVAEAEAERLRKLLDTGLKQRNLFQKGESKRSNEEIARLGGENRILKEERRRTQEAGIRKKASLWDSHLADLATRREAEAAALARGVEVDASEATSEDSDFSDSMLRISHVEENGESEVDPVVYPCEWRFSNSQTCTALALSREALHDHVFGSHIPVNILADSFPPSTTSS